MDLMLDIKNILLPEFVIILSILLCSILSFALPKEKQGVIFYFASVGVLFAIAALLVLDISTEVTAFYSSVVSNSFTFVFRAIILISTGLTLFLTKDYVKNFGRSIGEFYILILISSLGALLLAGANDLIMIFVALETLSISSFALCGYTKLDKLSNEAALKYLIIGAVSTAITLYGFSLLYGITAQTNLSEIAGFISNYAPNSVLYLAFIMVLGGFGFKLSMFPLHSWTPDVYQGAPVPVAAYLSVASKAAALAVLIRVMLSVFADLPLFSVIVAIFAVLTMFVGNLMAVGQENIKRLMAYSSVAQAGYMLLGLVILTVDGISSILFYLITYLFMNFGAWAVIEHFVCSAGKDNVSDFNGLAKNHRYIALAFSLCLLSLAGIPITAGFFGKFFLFKSVVIAGYDFLPLLLIALLNTAIAVFYYLKVIKALYVSKSEKQNSFELVPMPFESKAVLAFAVAGVLCVSIFAGFFIDMVEVSSLSIWKM